MDDRSGARAESRPDDPRRVGPFEIVSLIGFGGMGRVRLGRSGSGVLVAIKTIRSVLADDAAFRRRFAREVAAARRVSGAFTAAVVDADPDAPEPWMATRYAAAPSLHTLAAGCGPLRIRRAERELGLWRGRREEGEQLH
ncbi:hypothetical protein [Thermomonospora umbrina]|uniref:Protein kinase domain-containing protein n=1 Tax=Thermomonospora umbrina TaxID=111806 RepID=A0A3D9ST05_9ACTN|nr:hypothetical protein [Thermomonospora umbrina]REE97133.1 hypothetical protein DFJ69_2590 [Thermomonospora umbrina]